jgi:small-conductance mechanosensitive channel
MAANTDDGALLLVKKFGGIVLIFIGIICIAVGLEYRSNGFSPELTSAGIVALACGMASWRRSSDVIRTSRTSRP